jgi:hypothetical protein
MRGQVSVQGVELSSHHNHFQEAVLGAVGVAEVVDRPDKDTSEPDALVEIADGEQPVVAGELPGRRLNHERCAEKG